MHFPGRDLKSHAESVTPEVIAQQVVCGSNKQKHLDQIQQYVEAGFTHIYIHQVGQNQAEFMNFYQEQILPEFKGG